MTADKAALSPFLHLVDTVRHNLEHQQNWTQLQLHETGSGHGRLMLSGLPPRRMYIHPDEQIEIIRAEEALGNGYRIPQPPEYEWVLPMHLRERPSISQFAAIFDSIRALPPAAVEEEQEEEEEGARARDNTAQLKQWRKAKRGKRILLAIVQDDSTVVYYFMQDGIVKPRQN